MRVWVSEAFLAAVYVFICLGITIPEMQRNRNACSNSMRMRGGGKMFDIIAHTLLCTVDLAGPARPDSSETRALDPGFYSPPTADRHF